MMMSWTTISQDSSKAGGDERSDCQKDWDGKRMHDGVCFKRDRSRVKRERQYDRTNESREVLVRERTKDNDYSGS